MALPHVVPSGDRFTVMPGSGTYAFRLGRLAVAGKRRRHPVTEPGVVGDGRVTGPVERAFGPGKRGQPGQKAVRPGSPPVVTGRPDVAARVGSGGSQVGTVEFGDCLPGRRGREDELAISVRVRHDVAL